MPTLTVAQIGCGLFAEGTDMPNFAANPRTAVKWCCDVSRDRAERLAAAFAVPCVTTDVAEVMRDPEVRMVKIATSHEAHLPIVRAAAEHGKHVFCEKPLAMNETEGWEILRAVRTGGIKLCVDLNRRMSPSMRALRERWRAHRAHPTHPPWRYVETEREALPEESQTQFLARIQDESASYRMVHLDPLRGGGLIVGETVHWLDLACWFFEPQVPVRLTAWGSTRLSHGVHLQFSGGDQATITFSCGGTFDYPKELIEVASHGALLRNLHFVENRYYGIPGLEGETFALQRDGLPEVGPQGGLDGYLAKVRARVEGSTNSKYADRPLTVDKGHAAMLEAFVEAILTDGPSPCDERAGFQGSYLASLAIRSIELGHTLPVLPERLDPALV
jgi:predicted dehydrogenase